MKHHIGWRLALTILIVGLAACVPSLAMACGSCRGPGGAGSALTANYQSWGISATETMRLGHGIFDAHSNYRRFGEQSHDRVLELALSAAYRPFTFLELGAQTAYGHVLVGGPGFRSNRSALGDLGLRVRWEVLEELPLELTGQSRRPSLGLTFSARLPTGPVDRTTDGGRASAGPSPGTVGSTATSQGLGTTELALAVDLRKTFAQKWQIGVVGEGAWRAPDDSVGLDRELGPRGLLRVMGIRFLGDFTLGVFADVAAEGNVSYGGRTSPESSQRAVSVGASATYKTESGYRAGLALNAQPPIDGFAKNAVSAVGLSVFMAFTK